MGRSYAPEGFGFNGRKTKIRRAYFCTCYDKHDAKVKLAKYNEKTKGGIRRVIYICPTCHSLYFKSSTHTVPQFMGYESALIANIDSPLNNSIECPYCHNMACKSYESDTEAYYFCNDCYVLQKVSKTDLIDPIKLYPDPSISRRR